MNKILLVLILMLTVIGGGYFLLPQEKVNQFVKHLPLPFSELLSKDDSSVVKDEQIPTNPTKPVSLEIKKPIVETVIIKQEAVFKAETGTKTEKNTVEKAEVENPKVENSGENKANDDSSQALELAKISAGDTAEVIKVKKKIQKVLARLNQSDGTSDALKVRFDKIIQENRNITLELKRINDQIKEAH